MKSKYHKLQRQAEECSPNVLAVGALWTCERGRYDSPVKAAPKSLLSSGCVWRFYCITTYWTKKSKAKKKTALKQTLCKREHISLGKNIWPLWQASLFQ